MVYLGGVDILDMMNIYILDEILIENFILIIFNIFMI